MTGAQYGGGIGLAPVATLDEIRRGDFIVRVYQHLLGAVAAFVVFEAILVNTGVAERLFDFFWRGGGGRWLLFLGAFMIGQWFVSQAAADLFNPSKQYAALFGMAGLQSLIFAPFLHYIFNYQRDGGTTLAAAALITAMGFGGLTMVAFVTRKDLSFLRPMVMFGFVGALLLIVGAVAFGFDLGVWFSVAMIVLSGMAILYQTQQVMHQVPEQAHVAAALMLFGSLMTMFWYVLRLISQLRN